MMRKVLSLALSVLMIFMGIPVTSVQAAQNKDYFSPELAAKAVARFMNESKTVNGVYKSLRPVLSKGEIEGIQKVFAKDWNAKLPTCEAKGAQLVCGGETIATVNPNRTFSVKDQTFGSYEPGQLDSYLRNAKARLGGFEAASSFSLIPEAQAASWKWAAAALVGIGLLSGSLKTGLLAAGLVYLGAEVWESYKNNSVKCYGNDFVVRKKSRGGLGMANSTNYRVDSATASQLIGQEGIVCTEETAKQLQDGLKMGIVNPQDTGTAKTPATVGEPEGDK